VSLRCNVSYTDNCPKSIEFLRSLTNRPFTCTYCRVIVYDGQPGVESYARTPQVCTIYLRIKEFSQVDALCFVFTIIQSYTFFSSFALFLMFTITFAVIFCTHFYHLMFQHYHLSNPLEPSSSTF
jgi:hypothetical protein